MTEMRLLWLDDELVRDPRLGGGKGASLARLRASFDVPNGFVLTPSLQRLDESERTPELARAISEGWSKLREGGARGVAVRSSAVAEDGAETSFAGQLDTVLNVSGEEAIAAAVLSVWASASGERARAYDLGRGAPSAVPSVAVVVQEIVVPDAAGVAFTRDPVRGTDDIVVDANYGLGESVVSGLVTPDTFRVSRNGGVVETRIGSKLRMVVPVPGGTREVGVPRLLRDAASLSPELVLRVTELALRAENHSSHPVDIEFAVVGERVRLLQCRPITAGARSDARGPGEPPRGAV